MTVLSKLASALHRNDEQPNVALAREIFETHDAVAVQELVAALDHKDKGIQSDCIKVLYEIGALDPSLISDYAATFIALLESRNNRLQWGAMTALNSVVSEVPEIVYTALPRIIEVAGKGSVITKDYAVNILISLCAAKIDADGVFPLLIEQLLESPENQLPMYAERAVPIITPENKRRFVSALQSRLEDMTKDTKIKRVEKIIKKFS